ncbi:MAG: cupin domain-containing protein [Burkholderiaceae bacterium]|nr:cupin domain-containing protein [Burkholderiaceae bacterium]
MSAPRPLRALGKLPVEEFMRRYWQKRPLLVRQAIPALRSPVARERLFELAARDDVESRLVTAFGGRWRLAHGPFDARNLPSPRRRAWTLLVQGVNLHDEAADALLARFRILPDARLDDLMASYATDGGGVGPHVDSYDVFLVQTHGRRRWRIGRQRDLRLVPGLPLKILAGFTPTHEWVLDPGDLLYLPPGVAHEGVALGECITCSIGFRAPAWQELVEPWFAALAERASIAGRYRDPQQRPTRQPGRLPPAMCAAALRALGRIRPNRRDAARALLTQLSEPKPHVVFDRPARPLGMARFAAAVRARGVRLDPRTRLLYDGGDAAINGELFELGDRRAAAVLRSLADRRALEGASLHARDPKLRTLLYEWYVAGWLHLQPRGETRA